MDLTTSTASLLSDCFEGFTISDEVTWSLQSEVKGTTRLTVIYRHFVHLTLPLTSILVFVQDEGAPATMDKSKGGGGRAKTISKAKAPKRPAKRLSTMTRISRPLVKEQGSRVVTAVPVISSLFQRRNKKGFPLFKLPPELRLIIYHFVLENETEGYWELKLHPGQILAMDEDLGDDEPNKFFLPSHPKLSCLAVNKQMRLEVGSIFFACTVFDLTAYSGRRGDLNLACHFVEGIGEIGRRNMAAIKIVWWSQEWDIGELRGSYHAGTGPLLNGGPESVARRFTTLLEECKSLQMVEVLIPNRSGLSKSFFKPKLFDSCCEMLQLRRLKAHIPKLTIHTGNEPLYKWLEEPMMVERERHDDKEDGLRKRPRV